MSLRSILGEYRNAQPEMTNSTAPSPEEKVYRRVLLIAALDGWSVIGAAGLGTLISLALLNLSGVFVGLLVAATGAMELHGRRRLLRRDAAGMRWLVRAQTCLLSVILVYCVTRLGSFDAETAMGNLTPDMEAALAESGLSKADLLPLVQATFFTTYAVAAVISLIFQGGLTLYYRSRTARVTAFLAPPPLPPTNYSVL
jgi:hypothetical protein